MDASERRAFLTLLILAVAGQALLTALRAPNQAPGDVSLLPSASVEELEAHRDRVAELTRPLAKGERVDLDRAGLHELTRLPRIGPGLAQRIIADRNERGSFGSLEALGRVAGIGPATLDALEPHAAFSGVASSSPPLSGGPAAVHQAKLLNINVLDASALEGLPGIGPLRAAAIVAYRDSHGPFATISDLALVPGVGEGVLARIDSLVEAR